MPTENSPRGAAEHWQDCTDVYDLLDRVRLRPGSWLPGRSLRHLESVLTGYGVALGVHAVDEPFPFRPEGGFTQWLRERYGISGALTWCAEIERRTPPDSTPLDEFFRLLDDYRREGTCDPARETVTARRPGIDYMLDTFVTLFRRRRLLARAVLRLEEQGFCTARLAAAEWTTERDMHRAIAAALDFPDYYGHNLDALNDCLGDVACYGGYDGTPKGSGQGSTGLVLAFTDYDRFATACPGAAQTVLDIIADQARRAAVLRRRLVCLVHSDDPHIRFEPVGAMPVLWNDDRDGGRNDDEAVDGRRPR
ncbi:barstar family protein [Streptomyces sp. PTD5-9]|uniref:barstar family protein n=1 Tax=Streptomyces sp. PTD5-9 TaxID=3120150 RepID=UPI003008DC84